MTGTRVIAGAFKNQWVGPIPKTIFARPILARIKKSLFDILTPRIAGSNFLDLFAGSGSVGIEALSRGAGSVIFVDSNPQCKRWIESKVRELSQGMPAFFHGKKWAVHSADILKGLRWLEGEFDLIFVGAPYKDEMRNPMLMIGKVLQIVKNDGLLKKGGWLIAQHHIKEPFDLPEGFILFRSERYGDSVLSFVRYE